MTKPIPAGWLLVALWVSLACGPAPGPSITESELRAHVEVLAADGMAGRETGEPGVARAEEHVGRAFEAYGLTPLPGEEGFFLGFDLYRRDFAPHKLALTLEAGGAAHTARPGVDFRPFAFSAAGEVEAEVVFAGYGITAPEHDWDDYAGLDVAGKLVLVLRHEPRESDPQSVFAGAELTEHAQFLSKAENAREHGAAGILVATDPLHHEAGDDLRLGRGLALRPPRRGAEDGTLPAVHVARHLAETLAGERGLAALQRAVDGGAKPAALRLAGTRARLVVTPPSAEDRVPARNVAGFLPGRDPELAEQWIVVGAHHDHIGAYEGAGDTIYNGADDNASGTAAVLELAQAFAERQQRPRRSLVFVTFSAEEKGLLGSRALVRRLPMERVVFMLNLDMIGRNPQRPMRVLGDGFSRALRPILEAANAELDLPLAFAGSSYMAVSDHDAFFRRHVPFVFLFTGTHVDYHQVGDHVDKLDYGRMREITRLGFGALRQLAEADEAPVFVHRVPWLGLEIEMLGGGAVVTAVEPASRAAAGGFAPGDRVLAVGEQTLGDHRTAVDRSFGALEPGSEAAVRLRRGESEVELRIHRAPVGYLGIRPGVLPEERREALGLTADAGVAVRHIAPGSPAAVAGLAAGDVLIHVAGRPVDRASLGERLSQIGAGERVEMTVVRGSERLILPVVLGERPRR